MKRNLPLLALALSAFAIGTTEFVIMGLLPQVAATLHVSIPAAGWLVSGYALGVFVGAPIMAIATQRLPHRTALMGLMGIFIAGNVFCALSPTYPCLMLARIVTALCHGAFFGIGAVEAASLVAPDRRAQAVALMFTGLTLANVLGVPLGTALGQEAGWRTTFAVVAAIGVAAFLALARLLPRDASGADHPDMIRELTSLKFPVWLALSVTVIFSASLFAIFTYIAPLLNDVTHISPRGVSYTLFLIGVGLTIGNFVGGRMADWRVGTTLAATFISIAVTQALLTFTAHSLIPAELTLFAWSICAFAGVPALQINMVNFGKDAPNLISTLNIAAFNGGNALGAFAGGLVISGGLGLDAIPPTAAAFALAALALAWLSTAPILSQKRSPPHANPV
jgi:DHA1 family inner membrane transport protein